MRHTHLLGAKDPVIYKLVDSLNNEMGDAFPELINHKKIILDTIKDEEIKFKDTLDRGMTLLMNEIDTKVTSGVLPGVKAFELYDTYGFPLDLTEDVLSSYGWTVDHIGFEHCMNEQKNKARQAWSGSGDKLINSQVLKYLLKIPATIFKGYNDSILSTSIDVMINDNKIVKTISTGDKVDVVCNETIFYAESGGQISDIGTINRNNFKAKVIKSKKLKLNEDKTLFIISIEVLSGNLKTGDIITQTINKEFRKKICSHHSATHLLHEALRQKLGLHVAQKGSLVTDEKLRFDFSHPKPINESELCDIETEVNYRIFCNEYVDTEIMTPTEAIKIGAIALFGEKYGDEVRVVSMGKSTNLDKKAWSIELCGGTHVKNTSEISSFKIISETGVSSGVRRIEAVTNTAALKFYNSEINKVKHISNYMKTNPNQVIQKVEQLLIENQKINNELKNLKKRSSLLETKKSIQETINGFVFEYEIFEDLLVKELKSTAENLLKNSNANIVCLISKVDDKASIVITVDKITTKTLSAVDLVKEASVILGGKGGGGRPDMAQSGGASPEKALSAIETIKDYIKNKS